MFVRAAAAAAAAAAATAATVLPHSQCVGLAAWYVSKASSPPNRHTACILSSNSTLNGMMLLPISPIESSFC